MSATVATGEPEVLFEQRGAVLLVTLNRPSKFNAINEGLARGLGDAMTRADDDPSVRAVVLTGAGKAFCAGMDLDTFLAKDPIVHPSHPEWGVAGFCQRTLDIPVIAAVNGVAAGGGFELALGCDLILADECTRFALPEVTLGLFAAAGGLLRLPRRIPHHVANDLAFTGRFATAQELHQWGLVSRITAFGDVVHEAIDVASAIARHGVDATRATKQLLRVGADEGDTDRAWAQNQALMDEIFTTAEAHDSVQAFQSRSHR